MVNRRLLLTTIIVLVIIVITFGIWIILDNSVSDNKDSTNVENNITNNVNISTKIVNDDCVNEWSDYRKLINEEIESASTNITNELTRYLVKNVEGYIYIYQLNNFNEETLYKKTTISTEYLSVEDLHDLEIGIEVHGSKNLNKLLEDFE